MAEISEDPYDRLRGVSLFRELSAEELEFLSAQLHYRRLLPGEGLIHHLDHSSDVYFVLEGRFRATLYSVDGKETIFRDFAAGEFFGEFAAIDGEPRSTSIFALVPSNVAFLAASNFVELVVQNRVVSLALLRHFTSQTRVLVNRVFELSTRSVRDRLYAELLRLGGYNQSSAPELTITSFPTHAELASRIASHREAVTKELRVLTVQGVIERQRRTVVLKHPEFLARELDVV